MCLRRWAQEHDWRKSTLSLKFAFNLLMRLTAAQTFPNLSAANDLARPIFSNATRVRADVS